MRLGKKEKAVIRAFVDGDEADSRMLSTDGRRLDGHWLGGSGIAEWSGSVEYPKVVIFDLGSRAAQTVQKYLQKEVPPSMWGGWGFHPAGRR